MDMDKRELLIATTNKGKFQEIARRFGCCHLFFVLLMIRSVNPRTGRDRI